MNNFQDSLDELYNRVKQREFASGRGVGVEEPYFVFDYEPFRELEVRDYLLGTIMPKLSKRSDSQGVIPETLNLFEMVINGLRQDGYFEGALELQLAEGNDALVDALEGVANAEYLSDRISEELSESDCNLLFIHGVGSAWPMICIHSLLSALQSRLTDITVVLFFPGEYNEVAFKLFSMFREEHHYRTHHLLT